MWLKLCVYNNGLFIVCATYSPGRWDTSALIRKMKAVAMVASLILAMVTSRASIWIKARPVVLKPSIVLLVWPSETSRPPLYRPCSS